ncbi:putative membrane protein [Sporosarcina luteola]|nr:putative membrane protein [Sporosarcina luteola]
MKTDAKHLQQLQNREVHYKRNLWSGILFGLGFVAFIDETIFHQLLHWHKFYDKSTVAAGLVSDGLFHAFSWFATVGGLYLVADLRRLNALWHKVWWGGKLIGGGVFQLYDGTIQHKVMRIHQIRYQVDIVPYDVVWNVTAVLMIIIGFLLIRNAKQNQMTLKGTVLHGSS